MELANVADWLSEYSYPYVYIAIFLVTMLEHSGIPAVFVGAVILAPVLGLDRGTIFFLGVAGSMSSDLAYWGGGKLLHRFTFSWSRRLMQARAAIISWEGVFHENAGLFIFFCRFVAFMGKIVPAAGGYYNYRFIRLFLFSVTGSILHIGSYYILSLLLGEGIFEHETGITVVFFGVAILFIVGNYFLVKRLKKMRDDKMQALQPAPASEDSAS